MKWLAVFFIATGVAQMHMQVQVQAQTQTQTQTLIAPQATTPAFNDRVRLDDLKGLFIDKTEVTIAQFARYAKATGVQTRAEKEGGGFEYVAGWHRRAGWTWQRPDG